MLGTKEVRYCPAFGVVMGVEELVIHYDTEEAERVNAAAMAVCEIVRKAG